MTSIRNPATVKKGIALSIALLLVGMTTLSPAGAGIAITTGTLAEDVATGGVGVADDPATISLGLGTASLGASQVADGLPGGYNGIGDVGKVVGGVGGIA